MSSRPTEPDHSVRDVEVEAEAEASETTPLLNNEIAEDPEGSPQGRQSIEEPAWAHRSASSNTSTVFRLTVSSLASSVAVIILSVGTEIFRGVTGYVDWRYPSEFPPTLFTVSDFQNCCALHVIFVLAYTTPISANFVPS